MVVGIAWNAGAVRARLLARDRLGRDGARAIARLSSLDEALDELGRGPYDHDLEPGSTLTAAQWAAGATPLWHLRILAGWLPPAGGELVRTLAGWWELANLENHLAGLAAAARQEPYELGRLDTAWSRLRTTDSYAAVRDTLADSEWRDPGGDDLPTMVTWTRLAWVDRVAEAAEPAVRLAAGYGALVAARDLLVGARTLAGGPPHRIACLGVGWSDADELEQLAERLPDDAAWVLEDLDDPSRLWEAEVRWWRRLDTEGRSLLQRPSSGPEAVVGVVAVLLADAHRVEGALELAARGGGEEEMIHVGL